MITMIYSMLVGLKNRLFQLIALYGPGAKSFRVWLHRMRGVKIGKGVFIGTSSILETSFPKTISLGNNVSMSMRVVIIGHFKETTSKAITKNAITVKIEDDRYEENRCNPMCTSIYLLNSIDKCMLGIRTST